MAPNTQYGLVRRQEDRSERCSFGARRRNAIAVPPLRLAASLDMTDDVFFAAHDGLPREAPGSTATTELLWKLAAVRTGSPRMLDIGAGTGPATLVLAAMGAHVTAIDTHQPFLDELASRAAAAGVSDRVTTRNVGMEELDYQDHSFDVVWAEGAAYIIGFDTALRQWRRFVAPGGALVLTEADWITDQPGTGAAEFWNGGYPDMRTTGDNVSAAIGLAWTVAATYLLPDSDWDEYYVPLARRISDLRGHFSDEDLDLVAHEISIRQKFGTDYGYTGYVLRPRPDR